MFKGNTSQQGHKIARQEMKAWKSKVEQNVYTENDDFRHTLSMYFNNHDLRTLEEELSNFGAIVPKELEDWVAINDHRLNYPRVENYNGIGEVDNKIIHHPSLIESGSIISKTGLIEKLAKLGGMKEGHAFYFLSNHVGEAGHHCPLICSYEVVRLLRKLPNSVPNQDFIIERLLDRNYRTAYTASQFLTEVTGGSDVGKNATLAYQDENGDWRIKGEKWFTSNANAEVNIITARFDKDKKGTKGLAVFLVPSHLPNGEKNTYVFRRMKEKFGTKALASAEIDYHDALAYPLGPVEIGFNTLMSEIIHHSRIALSVAVLAFGNSAYRIARHYADHRSAFGEKIINYPLVQENLAHMRCELLAGIAGIYHLIDIQDKIDLGFYDGDRMQLFIRLMSNISKHLLSKWMVDLCHHAIDGLGGNGAIETFSAIPRLIRDTIVEENWEGSHNTLRMQVLRDIHKFQLDEVFFDVLKTEVECLENTYQEEINVYLKQLESQLEDLKSSSQSIQTLKIQETIQLIGAIYYYTLLMKEGLHQQNKLADKTKLAAAELFKVKHIKRTPITWNDNYIKTLQTIIRADYLQEKKAKVKSREASNVV